VDAVQPQGLVDAVGLGGGAALVHEQGEGQGVELEPAADPVSVLADDAQLVHAPGLESGVELDQVGNVLANVFGTKILRQLHADVVRAWLRAPVA